MYLRAYMRALLFLLSIISLSLARAQPLNLEYDRPVVRAIGTNKLAIKLLNERSKVCKSTRENVDDSGEFFLDDASSINRFRE